MDYLNITHYFDNKSMLVQLSYKIYSKLRGNYHYYLPYPEFSATKITSNIYIGDINSAYQKEHLNKEGITHIVSCVLGNTPGYPSDFKYLVVDVIDNEQENLTDKFEEAVHFIERAILENGKVLIHCVCGISRSVSITIAYLIYKEDMTIEEALKLIQSKRPIANPNPSFLKQLQLFYKNHGSK